MEALGFDRDRLQKAYEVLRLYGIAESGAKPPREEHQYTPEQLIAAKNSDPVFAGLCVFLETALGRGLKKSHYDCLYAMYDTLDMPSGLIMLLVNYCKAHGLLTPREMLKIAYQWADRGIRTYDQAVQYLDVVNRRSDRAVRVLRMFGIQDRAASEAETKYVEQWDSWGMSDELIKLAYERTVLRTGKVQWSYMSKILQSWHEQGCRTVRQVEKLESAPRAERPAAGKTSERTEKQEIVALITRRYEEKRRARETALAQRLEALRTRSPEFVKCEADRRSTAAAGARAAISGDRSKVSQLQQQARELAQKQAAILANLGLPEDWLSDRPDCPECRDTGYIGANMCSCFREACLEE
jgi:DnaD/phage-associated family protein